MGAAVQKKKGLTAIKAELGLHEFSLIARPWDQGHGRDLSLCVCSRHGHHAQSFNCRRQKGAPLPSNCVCVWPKMVDEGLRIGYFFMACHAVQFALQPIFTKEFISPSCVKFTLVLDCELMKVRFVSVSCRREFMPLASAGCYFFFSTASARRMVRGHPRLDYRRRANRRRHTRSHICCAERHDSSVLPAPRLPLV